MEWSVGIGSGVGELGLGASANLSPKSAMSRETTKVMITNLGVRVGVRHRSDNTVTESD